MIHTFDARRRLEMAPGVWREPGELVPEAHTWHRIDSYLNTGYLNEVDISEKDFRAAVKQFCPDEAERVLELAGLGDAVLEGAHLTPRVHVTKEPAKASTRKARASKEA